MSLGYTIATADNNHSITTVVLVKFLKMLGVLLQEIYVAKNNHTIAIYSSHSITTVESTVVLLKSKRSFCKLLVITKLLGKCHSTGDMFFLSSLEFNQVLYIRYNIPRKDIATTYVHTYRQGTFVHVLHIT